MKRITNEFSQAVFNLPWLVAQEEGLFAQEDIEVEFLRARQWDTTRARGRSSASRSLLAACTIRRASRRRLQCL